MILRFAVHHGATAALALALVISVSSAGADEIRDVRIEAEDIRDRAATLSTQFLGHDGFRGENYAEERLIDGENFYRMKDYQRAAIIFMDIIESYSDSPAYPDALFYFADALFLSRDYYGAREWFRHVLDESHKPGMARFRTQAIERLIEIAIHLDEFEGVEAYFDQLGQTPGPEARYIKGKYLYFREDHEAALREFGGVSGDKTLELKAAYFTGVIHTEAERYDRAIAIFSEAAERQPESPEDQEVIDLLNLALGRLYYEKDFVENASAAYQRIGQRSKYFDAALYEAASVLIRAGDTIRAERTLEVLTLAMPDSQYIPKAKLLRGNLLLRSGRYDDAEEVFEETIGEFTPVKEKLEELMVEQQDMRKFFSGLIERSMTTLDVSGMLPSLVVKWVTEENEVQRALELTSDLGVAREYARETERLVRLLEAVIDGPSRINAIPNLRSATRKSQQMSNQLSQLRGRLLSVEQRKLGGSDPRLEELRRERKQLQDDLDRLPTSGNEFDKREEKSRSVHRRMRHELARNEIRLDKLQAMIVALERFVEDPRYTEGASKDSLDALRSELLRHRRGVEEMREKVGSIRESVERARYRVGVGDSADERDRKLRERIRELSRRERELLRGRGGETGRRLDGAYAVIDQAEQQLSAFQRKVRAEADRRIEEMRAQVKREKDRLKRYRSEIQALNDEAEQVVGGVTYENFSSVRKRFHDLLLKADVGIIDVAWMRKEEHSDRISELTKARLSEIKRLDEEFQEVRDKEKE
ncbi:MAG: tetratricopeptide repeat protein [Polyangia bacterium]